MFTRPVIALKITSVCIYFISYSDIFSGSKDLFRGFSVVQMRKWHKEKKRRVCHGPWVLLAPHFVMPNSPTRDSHIPWYIVTVQGEGVMDTPSPSFLRHLPPSDLYGARINFWVHHTAYELLNPFQKLLLAVNNRYEPISNAICGLV